MSFSLHTPLAASPHSASSVRAVPPAEQEVNRILIVDDEQIVRDMFASCLSGRYPCVTAASVTEALALLAEQEFALIITDILMPGISGIELLRRVANLYPEIAVIMASGVDRTQRALDALRLGAFDYLIKPCDLDVLELSVERALDRRALLRNARRYKLDLEIRNAELARRQAELERLQAQLVHSEKMASLGQLAAGVAHELNNPVGFIHGNLELLDAGVTDLVRLLRRYDAAELPADLASDVAEIKDEIDYEASLADLSSMVSDCRGGAERIRDIVQNLRTFSRLDEVVFKKSDIHEGIDSTLRLLSRYYSAPDITLMRDYGELPAVECYAGQLNQVWMNLLVNAAQAVAAAGGGVVRITTRCNGDSVSVTIADTGTGIPPEHLNRIFDPFFTTKPVGEGTGLGLSICFSIIERHHGTVCVESRCAPRPAHGTIFSVTIPVIALPAPIEQSAHEQQAS